MSKLGPPYPSDAPLSQLLGHGRTARNHVVAYPRIDVASVLTSAVPHAPPPITPTCHRVNEQIFSQMPIRTGLSLGLLMYGEHVRLCETPP